MIEWLLVLLAIPFGLWLRKAASDELRSGRRWFEILAIASIAGTLVFIVISEQTAAATCLAAAIVAGISLKKSL